jgi:large subunit ribosomal protein L9
MRVVLLKDVSELGQAGEVKDVADGHARNFLIPRGFAQMATKGAERLWEEQKEAMVRRVATDRQNATEIAARLSGSTIVVTARAGEQDRLYGSVTGQQIAEAIKEQKEAMVRRVATDRQNATEIAARLSGSTIVVTARAGEQDRLYGSVTGQQIAEAIKEQTEIEIDRHALELEQPIRDLGTFTVTIKLGHAVEAAISVEVQKEEA